MCVCVRIQISHAFQTSIISARSKDFLLDVQW
jgi:hypothetical protein